MRLGEVLRKWRVMSEMDLRQASKKIGIAHSTLLRLEEGKLPPHGETVVKLIVWLLEDERANDNSQAEQPVPRAEPQLGSEAPTIEFTIPER